MTAELLAEVGRRAVRAHYALLHANLAMKGLTAADPRYVAQVGWCEAAVVELSRAKWLHGRATGDLADFAVPTGRASDLRAALAGYERAEGLAIAAGRPEPADQAPQPRAHVPAGAEIRYASGVPLVPSICPIVVLRGDWEAMGRQYVRQVVAVFGRFVFERPAARSFSDAELRELRHWEAELRRAAPEVAAFARGMAHGARLAGLPLSEAQALALWTGVDPPAREHVGMGVLDAVGGNAAAYFADRPDDAAAVAGALEPPCSGCCAWGAASRDGDLVLGATTDHDCTFQATIVAYPDDGHPLVYTPFSVNGSIPGVGRWFFAGHPGFNGQGLAYVHHGGSGGVEPPEEWGYGVRRGASTLHLLARAGSAREACERELAWPVGDAGYLLGTAGGFYADSDYGYVLEARSGAPERPRPLLRETTPDANGGEHQFLYANNNCVSPDAGAGFCPPEGGYRYELEAGWFTLEPALGGAAGEAARRLMAMSSESRNRYLHKHLLAADGGIDLPYLEALYRCGPRFPDRPWEEIERAWLAGERMEGSVSHRGNAFTALARPATGLYRGCIGSAAHRSVPPNKPGHGFFYPDETGTFWDIELAETPAEVVDRARATARALAERARALANGSSREGLLARWLADADAELATEAAIGACQAGEDPDSRPAAAAWALRRVTRAQVRARQVIEALEPPVREPERLLDPVAS